MKVFISCTKSKLDHPCPAAELYTASALFRKHLAYARSIAEDRDIFILSALYGLVPLDRVLDPYQATLYDYSPADRVRWGQHVFRQAKSYGILSSEHIVLLAGHLYCSEVVKYFPNHEIPFEGLGIGHLMHALDVEENPHDKNQS